MVVPLEMIAAVAALQAQPNSPQAPLRSGDRTFGGATAGHNEGPQIKPFVSHLPIQLRAPGGIRTVSRSMSSLRMIWHASLEVRVA
jgi:hypothetical protein